MFAEECRVLRCVKGEFMHLQLQLGKQLRMCLLWRSFRKVRGTFGEASWQVQVLTYKESHELQAHTTISFMFH